MKTYGVLLIGCGHIGMEHLLAIHHRENIRVEAVVDKNGAVAEAAARRCGVANWGTDYMEFLSSDKVDIVIIATYADTHLPILKDCLAHHKHVLCEKPIGGTLEVGREFVRLAKAAPEKVLVGHILRHNASYKKIRELIRGGAIGELRLARMSQNHHTMDWERHRRLLQDCSPVVDCGVHYFDLMQWFTDSPIIQVSGFSTATQDDTDRDNYNMVSFRMENGCTGFYEVGWGQSMRTSCLREFVGTKGRITLDMQIYRGEEFEEGDRLTVYHSDTGVYETVNVQALYKDMYAQLQTLIRMIEEDDPGSPTIDDVWSAFRVTLAAERAILTGRTVKVEELD